MMSINKLLICEIIVLVCISFPTNANHLETPVKGYEEELEVYEKELNDLYHNRRVDDRGTPLQNIMASAASASMTELANTMMSQVAMGNGIMATIMADMAQIMVNSPQPSTTTTNESNLFANNFLFTLSKITDSYLRVTKTAKVVLDDYIQKHNH